jgi:hypothetical protein
MSKHKNKRHGSQKDLDRAYIEDLLKNAIEEREKAHKEKLEKIKIVEQKHLTHVSDAVQKKPNPAAQKPLTQHQKRLALQEKNKLQREETELKQEKFDLAKLVKIEIPKDPSKYAEFAVKYNFPKVLKGLIEKDFLEYDPNNFPLLMLALANKHKNGVNSDEIILMLINSGKINLNKTNDAYRKADDDFTEANGHAALHEASMYKDKNVIKALIGPVWKKTQKC